MVGALKYIKNSLVLNFIAHYFLWVITFLISRIVFLLYHFSDVSSESFSEIVSSVFIGLKLDFSAAVYFSAIPFLLLFLFNVFRIAFIKKLILFYYFIIGFGLGLLVFSELELYSAWGYKMHYKVLKHLANPSEVYGTANFMQIVLGISGALIYGGGLLIISNKIIEFVHKFKWKELIIYFTVIPALLFVALRGGLNQIPVQVGDVFYSKNNTLNYAATNSVWYFGHSILENTSDIDETKYQFYTEEEAKFIFDDIYRCSNDSIQSPLKSSRPNIVYIILESWTADLIEVLGGEKGVTPFFNSLSEGGILFTNFYASGERSDQGIATILSGFPAQPTTSIVSQTSKYEKLPCINKDLKIEGYSSLFVFGGQLNYGNIKSYLVYNQFDKLVEESDFEADDNLHGKLGWHDEVVLPRFFSEINQLNEPFFANVFTLSTHEPFDIPKKNFIDWKGEFPDYINAAYYADSCLKNFFEQAKTQEWYQNTLFVLVADHGHHSHKKHDFFSPEYRKIPLLLVGDAIVDALKGLKIEAPKSQSDISASILSFMGINNSQYIYSKNLLDTTCNSFAYYSHINGFGWVERDGYMVYNIMTEKYLHSSNEEFEKKNSQKGKAYLQILMDDYFRK